MLTVYYITKPFDKENEDNLEETTGRLEELTTLRATLRDERNLAVMNLDAIIADSTSTVAEKEAALNEKRYLNTLTEKELLLELEVINKGYRDCFVHASDTAIDITVVSEEDSLTVANEIIIMAMTDFDRDFSNVHVEFQTAEEVMGTVD
jgi:hypothetical protein